MGSRSQLQPGPFRLIDKDALLRQVALQSPIRTLQGALYVLNDLNVGNARYQNTQFLTAHRWIRMLLTSQERHPMQVVALSPMAI